VYFTIEVVVDVVIVNSRALARATKRLSGSFTFARQRFAARKSARPTEKEESIRGQFTQTRVRLHDAKK
jgi:hypothetical protein